VDVELAIGTQRHDATVPTTPALAIVTYVRCDEWKGGGLPATVTLIG